MNMRKKICVAVLVAVSLLAVGGGLSAATYKSADGTVVITATPIEFYQSKLVAKGGVHLETRDADSKTSLTADAADLTLTLFSSPDSRTSTSGMGMLKNAALNGPLSIVYVATEPSGTKTRTTAYADKAVYESTTQIVTLTGSVKIVYENPEVFGAPTVATGDQAQVNVKPGIGPDVFRFRIEGSKEPSRIEVTPIAGEAAK